MISFNIMQMITVIVVLLTVVASATARSCFTCGGSGKDDCPARGYGKGQCPSDKTECFVNTVTIDDGDVATERGCGTCPGGDDVDCKHDNGVTECYSCCEKKDNCNGFAKRAVIEKAIARKTFELEAMKRMEEIAKREEEREVGDLKRELLELLGMKK